MRGHPPLLIDWDFHAWKSISTISCYHSLINIFLCTAKKTKNNKNMEFRQERMDLQIDDHESYQVKVVIREKMVLSSTKVKNGFWDGSWVWDLFGKVICRYSGRGSIEPTTALRVCTVTHVFGICATACFMNRHSQMRIHHTVCP